MLTWSCKQLTLEGKAHLNSPGNIKTTSTLVVYNSKLPLAVFGYTVGLCTDDTVLEPIVRLHCPLVTISSIIFKSRCRIKNAKLLREAIKQLQSLHPGYNLLFVVSNPLLSALLKHFGAEKVAWSSSYLIGNKVPKRVARLAVSI